MKYAMRACDHSDFFMWNAGHESVGLKKRVSSTSHDINATRGMPITSFIRSFSGRIPLYTLGDEAKRTRGLSDQPKVIISQ